MKKTLRSVLTLLLVVAMLFGVMAPTVAYAANGAETGIGGEGGEGSVGGSYDAGWCVIEYDADELKITFNPDAESLLDMNKDKIKEMLNTVIEAVKTIVIDELKNSVEDDFTTGGQTVSIRDAWKKIIDNYLLTIDSLADFDETERYLQFFKMVLASEQNEEYYINELIDYICNMVELAVRGGVFTLEDLETFGVDEIKNTVDKLFKEQVEILLGKKVAKYVDTYIGWLLGPADAALEGIDEDIEQFINAEVKDYITEMAGKYVDGESITDYLSSVIFGYVDKKLEVFAKNKITAYAKDGTTGNVNIDNAIAEEIEVFVGLKISAYANYVYGVTSDMPAFYNEIDQSVRMYIDVSSLPNKADFDAALNENRDRVYESAISNILGVKDWNDISDWDDERFTDLVGRIVQRVRSLSGDIKDAVTDEVEAILSSENAVGVLREILSDSDNNDVEELKEQIKTEIIDRTNFDATQDVDTDSFTNRVFILGLGIGRNEFYNEHLSVYVNSFIESYVSLVDDLKENGQTFDIQNLVSYLESVKVKEQGGEYSEIYGDFGNGYVISTEAVNELLKTLPTLAELSEMDDDEMRWSYDFLIETDFGQTDFTITLQIGDGYDTVRKVAGLIGDHLDVYRTSDGYLKVNLRVPAKFAELLLRACRTGKISEETKNKIFSLLTYDVEEAYGLFSDKVTFENIIDVLEEIDFEGLLDRDFISQYVDLSGLTNEQIVAKVKEYEGYFNKFKSVVTRIYNRLPERYLDNEIMDYYVSDGLFGYKNEFTVSYETIEKAITKVMPGYGATLLSFFDIGDSISAKVDLSLSFADINRIEYILPGADEPYRVGLLPVGADVGMFAELTEYGGKQVCYWVETDNKGNQSIITAMPDRDVKLTPVFIGDLTVSVEKPENTIKEFTGEPIRLSINIGDFSEDGATVEYYWYKLPLTNLFALDNSSAELVPVIPGTTAIELVNVSDSGLYYYVVKVTKGNATEEYTNKDNPIEVIINPIELDLGDLRWNQVQFLYDGELKTVYIENVPDYLDIKYEGNYSEIGSDSEDCIYIAKASAKLKDGLLEENYDISGEIADHEWKIVYRTGDDTVVIPSDLEWNYSVPFEYDGKEHLVGLILGSEFPAGVEVSFEIDTENGITNKATYAGTYIARAVFTSTEGKTVVCDVDYELQWAISPMTVTLSDLVWNYGSAFTFNEKEQRVYLVGLPKGLILDYSGTTAATNVGRYKAEVEISVEEGFESNFVLVDTKSTLDWQINKLIIDLSGVDWDYTNPPVFNKTNQVISLAGISDETVELLSRVGYDLVIKGNSATNAGKYTATAKLVGVSANCDAVGFSVAALEWEILKADFDMSGVSFPDKTVAYTGKDVTVGIIGKLPSGLVVNYTADTTYRYMGKYEITAVFSLANPEDPLVNFDNYNEVAPMTMKLTILYELQNDFTYGSVTEPPVITVSSENGIPKDHVFKVSDDSHIYTGFYISEERYGRVISAYDICFKRGGTYMPVTDNFLVKIRIPDAYRDSDSLTVVYVSENGGVEELAFTRKVEGEYEYIEFTTGHFSTYALLNIEDAPVKVIPSDYSWIWALVIVLAVLLVLALIIIFIIRRRRKNNGTPNGPDDGNADSAQAKEEEPETEAPVAKEKAEVLDAEAPMAEEKAEVPETEAPEVVVVIGKEPAEDEIQSAVPVGDPVPVRYRHSFESKMIQAETDIQDYYTAIKNALLSYKGVKSRLSFNYEAFNKGRIQCAKLNLKGRTLVVYLNLNPANYNINKYHFVDMTDKVKSEKDKLVMLMKVRSDRALNYTVELIGEMMRVLEIPAGEPQTVDYHMPYESTEELAKRGLVKVILPAGMTLDENSNIVKVNVGELIDSSNSEKSQTEPQTSVTVENTALNEAAETPVVDETPAAEPIKVVYADAAVADSLLTDEEAASHVEVAHTGANQRKGKLGEINLDTICANFDSNDTVNLAALKEKGLIGKNIARVKVLARGTMNKSLTVVASKFSMQAIKMIELAGGAVVIED